MADAKPQEKKPANFKKYESAMAAAALPNDPSYKPFAINAMVGFYKQFDMDKDPAIQRMLSDTAAALKAGQGYSPEMAQAIGLYAKKFKGEIEAGTVKEFVAYTGYVIPDKLKPLLEKYNDSSVKDLKEEDEDQAKVKVALQLLERNHVMGGLATSLIKKSIAESTKGGLEALLAEENELARAA